MLFPTVEWGGMTADPSIFVQSALDMHQVQQQSQGQWRIFSKLGIVANRLNSNNKTEYNVSLNYCISHYTGAGYSNSRYVGEIIDNAYACLPM